MVDNQPNRYAVIGNPVTHSMSPYLHKKFAEQFGVELHYEKIQAEKTTFKNRVEAFFAAGGLGMNVTTPFKADAAELVQHCSDSAKAAQSVNTLIFDRDSNSLSGTSTDGIGWLRHIRWLKIDLKARNILIIGAGGAARILHQQLLSEAVGSIHICNRTEQRARHLATSLTTVSGLNNIPDRPWDLIINTLSVGWQGDFPELNVTINPATRAYDLNYGEGATAFRNYFIGKGGMATAFYDGWGMLVEQAAESFYLWWGLRPATEAIIRQGMPAPDDVR